MVRAAECSNCKHVDNDLINYNQLDAVKKEAVCLICKISPVVKWLCLSKDCHFVGCGSRSKNHAEQHATESSHTLQLNLKNDRVWCHACELEVFLDNDPPWTFLKQYFKAESNNAETSKTKPSPACTKQTTDNTDNVVRRRKNSPSKKSNSGNTSETKVKQSVIPYPDISKISVADEVKAASVAVISDRPVVNRIVLGPTDASNFPNFFTAGRLYNEREKHTIEPHLSEFADEFQVPGLVGLRNLGNTCYMNAVLQALSNCPPLSDYQLNCRLPVDYRQRCLALVYQKLTKDMWNEEKRLPYVAPYDLLQIMRLIYPTFRSFQQQDAQEFLRCFLDALHDDLKQPVYEWELRGKFCNGNNDRPSSPLSCWGVKRGRISTESRCEIVDSGVQSHAGSEHSSAASVKKRKMNATDDNENETASWCDEAKKFGNLSTGDVTLHSSGGSSSSSVEEENYRTCDSGWSSDMEVSRNSYDQDEDDVDKGYNLRPRCAAKSERSLRTYKSLHRSAESLVSVSSFGLQTHGDLGDNSARRFSRRQKVVRYSPERIPLRRAVRYRSIVSDVFDGRLLSSVQCLTCNTISETKETFQDLSLSIPSKEQVDMLKKRTQQFQTSYTGSPASSTANSSTDQQSWLWWIYSWLISWFVGPKITLEDCLAAFFSADDLKGEDMYSCDKCKKLRNGAKYCSLLSLPEVLCIHLKRFRHESVYSSKINSYVEFPLENLNLGPFTNKHSRDEVQMYDLTGVICHRGGFDSGHYTAYCLNPHNYRWYEFDDQFATEVDDYTVRNVEAYVLFYRKKSDKMDRLRNDVNQMVRNVKANDTNFYVSREWIHRFNTFAEPGPVTNFDFLCPHGWISPSKADHLSDLYCDVPEKIWHLLYNEFGGGPVCLQLRHCFECQQHRTRITVKRQRESEMFTQLQKQFRATFKPGDYCNYCLSTKWFREWDDFVCGREEEPPGPISNNDIVAKRADKIEPYQLVPNAYHLKISKDMWDFFLQSYGGGPEILITPNLPPSMLSLKSSSK